MIHRYHQGVKFMVKISIVKTGITNLTTDAIVNAANENLARGSGVCGVIFNAAGPQELQTAFKNHHLRVNQSKLLPFGRVPSSRSW